MSNASLSCQRKQMRYWSLILMLYCPSRFPLRISRRFPLSSERSVKLVAAPILASFIIALELSSKGIRFAVFFDLKP